MKYPMLMVVLLFSAVTCTSQALFTFGGKSVSADEFMRSFTKNDTGKEDRKSAMEKYLELYIRFKLKVQAAYDLKMDTLGNQKSDIASYADQIKPIYLLDQVTLDSLLLQAHQRSLLEIELEHRFIPNGSNTDSGFQRLGFLSAFALPYALENVAYSLKDGETSSPVKSNEGTHYLRRIKSRPARGPIQFFHLLVSLPADAKAEEIASRKTWADSLRQWVANGASMDSVARAFSEDRSTSSNGGLVENFKAGTYDPTFEDVVLKLKDGELSEVFKTDFGFHFIQKINEFPLPVTLEDNAYALRENILKDDRKQIAENAMISASIGKNGLTASTPDKLGYISKNLERFSKPFADQLKEFKEGNLLFEIMERMVWKKANQDEAKLKAFHALNKSKYQWKKSVNAAIITIPSKEMATDIRTHYLKTLSIDNIRKRYGDIALIDTGRYEAGELIGIGDANAKTNFVGEIHSNESDGSATFVVINKVYKDPSIKTFSEARGQVTNDYQQSLEDRWMADMKRKYPVVVNPKVWSGLLNR